MILLIDNNDSFTFNIVELLRKVTDTPVCVRRAAPELIDSVNDYSHIIFSPGPGLPSDFPLMEALLTRYDTTKSFLGICLGHQAICTHYGGRLRRLQNVAHGMESTITCNSSSHLFRGIDSMIVGRYHSWIVENLPEELHLTAVDNSGLIMGIEHNCRNIYGIQFHPESYITKGGEAIFRNFIYGVD